MKLTFDWEEINKLKGSDLKEAVFNIIQEASYALQSFEIDDPDLLEIIPRLLDLIERHESDLNSFREITSSLARASGLWNYIDTEFADTSEKFIAQVVGNTKLEGIRLHREQMKALNLLLDGKSLILSAPTSFGKSLLIDALLATQKYKRVAIILPTISLMDEFRRRFQHRFSDEFDLILHQSELSSDRPTIFLGTQERLLSRKDLENLDLLVVDEFYKLDSRRNDERFVALNAIVCRLLKKTKQFFFLGPNVNSIVTSDRYLGDSIFFKTRFSTVAINILDFKKDKDKEQRLFLEVNQQKNWPALVFMSSPSKANEISLKFSQINVLALSEKAREFSRWLKENLGENNLISKLVDARIAIHHGRIPRPISAKMLSMFDTEELPILFCTSTIIEGVNTSAKTVMIYDKKISNKRYDFFTFSNIRGRAGRLGKHYVGDVMLFNEMPEKTVLDVSPLISQEHDDQCPDEYIIYLDGDYQIDEAPRKYQDWCSKLNIQGDDLKIAASVGLENALRLKNEIDGFVTKGNLLFWSGFPNRVNIYKMCNIIFKVKKVRTFGTKSYKQLSFFILSLMRKRSMKEFFVDIDKNYQGVDNARDGIFQFLRSCEYDLSNYVSLFEIFVKKHDPNVDYSYLIGGMNKWFTSDVLKELDEEGVPIQISERFFEEGDTKYGLKERLRRMCTNNSDRLTGFEREWLLDIL